MLSSILKYKVKIIFCFLIYLGGIPIIAGYAQSDVNTLDRHLEPVIVTGLDEFVGAWIGEQNNELFLYAYRASETAWEQIPFQIDEKSASGDYFIPDDGKWDVNDELAFMAKDAGDRGLSSWIDDESSRPIRYEIQIADPTASNKEAWVYLYRSSTLELEPGVEDYIDYFPNAINMGADSIRSKFYELANAAHGYPEDLIILQPGNLQNDVFTKNKTAIDILDRLKFRAEGTIYVKVGFIRIPFGFYANEEGITVTSVEVIDGLLRVIRKLEATLKIVVNNLPDEDIPFTPPPAIYYPYHISLSVRVGAITGIDADISSAKVTMDLNEDAPNMKFISANNPEPGFIINGSQDSPNTIIDNVLSDSNWVYINNEQKGTIVHFFPLMSTVGGTRKLYYADTMSKVSGDTGDNRSFGDTGIDISGGINPPFTMSYKGYFLSKDSTNSELGAKLAHYEKNPFQINAVPQDYGTVPVELVAFNVTVEKRDVHLTWITATESNNFGFDIERKNQDADLWQKIAFESGEGTTTNPVHYEYIDYNLQSAVYDYRLKQIDTNGSFEYSNIVMAVVGLPQTFALSQNYPNPFNPVTEIQYELPFQADDMVKQNMTILKIYNLLGKEVKTLVDKEQEPGFYTASWDGRDNSGYQSPSGVYFYRLVSASFVATKKMVLVR